MAMAIDRQPVDRVSVFILPIAIPHMVTVMNVFVKGLGKTHAKRFHQTENTIEGSPREIGVVQEIVGNPIDVPGNADRVDNSHEDDYPPRSNGKNREKGQHIGKVQKTAQRRQDIPF